jgi:DNA-binding transcriptional regulator GbsR (MarR family)
VLNVQDKRSAGSDARLRIADEFGHAWARYGLALTVGRVFGLLLASDGPLSLDEIAAELGVSKSGASVAARELERSGIARRLGTSGSRRVLYEAAGSMEPSFDATFARIRESLELIERSEPLLRAGPALERMRLMRELHEFWLTEIEGVKERWRRRRTAK